jgi:phospholipase/carboxylesterase
MQNNMNALLEHITIEPIEPAQATVIWFHGLGADGHDFEPIVPQLALPQTLPIRFIFPHAPVIPVSINGGYPMPAWFDIISLLPKLEIDMQGLSAAIHAAQDLIQSEINKGIPAQRIFLAGFSQGGAVALSTALSYPTPLAGIIALSTFIPTAQLAQMKTVQQIPIYMAHGSFDDVLPMPLGELTYQLLKKRGVSIEWQTYSMGHEVCHAEITAISQWLQTNTLVAEKNRAD